MPTPDEAPPGRDTPLPTAQRHYVNQAPLQGPYPEGSETACFALGCFWGAERKFWQTPGVLVTAVGYTGGFTPNPSYEEICSGLTGHCEAVKVVFDPRKISYEQLVRLFFESHDPTQGMRQGNDIGPQYRSGLYVLNEAQRNTAVAARDHYAKALAEHGFGPITTEIVDAPPFYYASEHHQQYLAKNPEGYCGLGGTGVACPVGTGFRP